MSRTDVSDSQRIRRLVACAGAGGPAKGGSKSVGLRAFHASKRAWQERQVSTGSFPIGLSNRPRAARHDKRRAGAAAAPALFMSGRSGVMLRVWFAARQRRSCAHALSRRLYDTRATRRRHVAGGCLNSHHCDCRRRCRQRDADRAGHAAHHLDDRCPDGTSRRGAGHRRSSHRRSGPEVHSENTASERAARHGQGDQRRQSDRCRAARRKAGIRADRGHARSSRPAEVSAFPGRRPAWAARVVTASRHSQSISPRRMIMIRSCGASSRSVSRGSRSSTRRRSVRPMPPCEAATVLRLTLWSQSLARLPRSA